MSRNQFEELRENCVSMRHGLNPPVFMVFGDTLIVSTGPDLGLFISSCGTAVAAGLLNVLLGLKETMRKFLGSLILFFSSPAFSGDLLGDYSAVTESEVVIELSVRKDSKAQLTVKVLAVEETEETWRKSTNSLIVKFLTGEEIEYEILACLPYSEFGIEGCSFGLKPVHGTFAEDDLLLKYGLWRDEDLKGIWNN